MVTTADGSRGGAGNKFLPGPRLLPSPLGVPEGKEKYPKKLCHVVVLQPMLRAHAQRTREEVGFPFTIAPSL